ncbi:MAG: phosphate ABC transporter substrate-binding protein [Gammaproteobacteria bacterium]|nr:MAG: phosphate ABC transporter substrate-binding protein [Gammaproteobacteria bacterium]
MILLTSLITFSTAYKQAFGQEIAVVVNPSFPENLIQKSDLKMIFLGRRRLLDNGEKIAVVNLPYNDPLRFDFSHKLLNKHPSRVDAVWARLLFSGVASPPPVLPNDQEVKRWLNKNKYGIGYIKNDSIDKSVKVIHVIE